MPRDLSAEFKTDGKTVWRTVFASGYALDGRKATDKDLDRIFTNSMIAMNELDLTPVIKEGHDQQTQEMCGYIRDFRLRRCVLPHGKKGKAIQAELFMYPETYAKYEAGKLPNLSVEIPDWSQADNGKKIGKTIEGVALLGKDIPALPWLNKVQFAPEGEYAADNSRIKIYVNSYKREDDMPNRRQGNYGDAPPPEDPNMEDDTPPAEMEDDQPPPEQQAKYDMDAANSAIEDVISALQDALDSDDPEEKGEIIEECAQNLLDAASEVEDMASKSYGKSLAGMLQILSAKLSFGKKNKPQGKQPVRRSAPPKTAYQKKREAREQSQYRQTQKELAELRDARRNELFSRLHGDKKVLKGHREQFEKIYAALGHEQCEQHYNDKPQIAGLPNAGGARPGKTLGTVENTGDAEASGKTKEQWAKHYLDNRMASTQEEAEKMADFKIKKYKMIKERTTSSATRN